jgi:hypothetical protein
MRVRCFTIITIILSNIVLRILKDPLANFVITFTLKDSRATWLCLLMLLSLTTKFIPLVMERGTSLVKHTSQKGTQAHGLPL